MDLDCNEEEIDPTKLPMQEEIMKYFFNQWSIICKAFGQELSETKEEEILHKYCINFEKNLKDLLKKVSGHYVIGESFQNLVLYCTQLGRGDNMEATYENIQVMLPMALMLHILY